MIANNINGCTLAALPYLYLVRRNTFSPGNGFWPSFFTAALALPRSGAALTRTRKLSPSHPAIALLEAPGTTLTASLVTGELSHKSAMASNYFIELVGEGFAITMVQRCLATRINAAGTQRFHQVTHGQSSLDVVRGVEFSARI